MIPEKQETKEMSHSIVPADYLENLQVIYINLTISILTLNLNDLNTPIKRQKLTKDRSDKKARPNLFAAYKKHLLKRCKKYITPRTSQETRYAILILDKEIVRVKNITVTRQGQPRVCLPQTGL